MGAFLKAMPKATGTAGAGRPSLGGAREEPPKSDAPAEIGLTKKQSARAQKLAAIPADDFAERIEAAKDEGKLTAAASQTVTDSHSPLLWRLRITKRAEQRERNTTKDKAG